MRKLIALSVVAWMIGLFPVAQAARSATAGATDFTSLARPLAELQNPYQDSGSYDPYTGEQLDNLLAPIALYPDALLAQVLLATTFPDQIEDAAQYTRNNGPNGIDYQNWDVSVKAVAHYPSVLSMLDDMLDWTTAVGQAYVYQSTDVMTSVQHLRSLAYSQGNLISTPQQQVIVDGGYIQIDPAQPQVIYVPVYDPGVIYERRVYSPGVGFGGFFNFGGGFAIGAWLNYDLDWGSHRVVYDGWRSNETGWRQRSRPYVQINNVYVNNSYVNVNVNRTVVNRHVDYTKVNHFNSVHHDVNYDNRARSQPNNSGNNRPGVPRSTGQPGGQPGLQPGNGRPPSDGRGFNPSGRNQPPAANMPAPPRPLVDRPNGDRSNGDRANDRGGRNQLPQGAVQPQPAPQPNGRTSNPGARNQPPSAAPVQPTIKAPPQQSNRSFTAPGQNPNQQPQPNNNQPPAPRPQFVPRPAPQTPRASTAPAPPPAAQPAPHTPDQSKGSQGQGQGQGQRGGGRDGGGPNNGKGR